MGLWQGIFIVLGCALAGLVVGLLLIYVLQGIKKKRSSFPQKEADLIKTESPEISLPVKSNGQNEDTLEILVKNHKDGIRAGNQRQPHGTDAPIVPDFINQKNAPIVAKQEKPSPIEAIHWTELFKQGNALPIEEHKEDKRFSEPLSPQQPAAVSQKNAIIAEEHKKPPESGVRKKPEIVNDKSAPIVREQRKSPKPDASKEPEIAKQKSTPIAEKKKEHPKSDFIKELETNLTIATTPWADKLLPFQTDCWDAKHGEGEPLLTTHHQDLMQLYVDIGLANNIVWLATEIGHRSKDLDESYIKLCAGIAESLRRVVPSSNVTIQ